MQRPSALCAAQCIALGLVLLLVPMADALREQEANGPPDTKELIDVDRLWS